MRIQATWVEGMQFVAFGEASGATAPIDTAHADGSPRRGVSPMEMLLMGVAGCTGMDVIAVLTKKRQRVTHFYLNVQGYRNEEHPKSYNKIEVEYVVRGYDRFFKPRKLAIHLDAYRLKSALCRMLGFSSCLSRHRVPDYFRKLARALYRLFRALPHDGVCYA